jgi:hypothetical protein
MPLRILITLGLATLGVAVVALRLEQGRHLREIQKIQVAKTETRQRIWTQHMKLARLRSPQVVRERAARFNAEASPEPDVPAQTRPAEST